VAEIGFLAGFGQSSEEMKKFYAITLVGEQTVDGKKTSVLELKPKSAQAASMFTSITLWFDQQRWIPVQIKTTEASRDYMIMKFMNIRMNARIPESVFDLKLPKDVQVIG
jgi:outer membrane lipoprotein-sorting protein